MGGEVKKGARDSRTRPLREELRNVVAAGGYFV